MQINEVNMPIVRDIHGVSNLKTDQQVKFTLVNQIDESELQDKLRDMLDKITAQGNKIAEHMDIRDIKTYRAMISEFFNEVVAGNFKFNRDSYLDKRGKHRVYGIINQVNQKLDDIARELMKDEKNAIKILDSIGEIQGLLLDIET